MKSEYVRGQSPLLEGLRGYIGVDEESALTLLLGGRRYFVERLKLR